MIPSQVTLVEVGPRDGLQNEAQPVPAAQKIELVHRLQAAGCRDIEVTSFVSPKWVPQMADAAQVMAGIARPAGVRHSVLTPNMKGLEAALAAPRGQWPDEVVVFGAASEAFSQRNINCSIAESIERFRPVVAAAHAAGLPAYVPPRPPACTASITSARPVTADSGSPPAIPFAVVMRSGMTPSCALANQSPVRQNPD